MVWLYVEWWVDCRLQRLANVSAEVLQQRVRRTVGASCCIWRYGASNGFYEKGALMISDRLVRQTLASSGRSAHAAATRPALSHYVNGMLIT